MGQITTGIMWGVRVPEGVCMWDDENFAGLLDRWCDECEPLIGAHDAKVEAWVAAKPGRMPWHRMDGRDRYVPDYEPDAGVRAVFPKAYRNAVARWARFRRWCDAHRDIAGAEHFAQTAPSLWLVPTEVA